MARQWTIGNKIAAGLSALAVATVAVSTVAIFALQTVAAAKDQVINVDARTLIDNKELAHTLSSTAASARAYLLTMNETYLESMREQRRNFSEVLAHLRRDASSEEGRRFVADIERLELDHQKALEETFALRRSNQPLETVVNRFESEVTPIREEIKRRQTSFDSFKEQALEQGKSAASTAAQRAIQLLLLIAAAAVIAAIALTVLLSRGLARQIGTAVHHIQTSSTQLQSATTEQAAGTREQTSAVAEVSATLKELVSTARQMMENSQRVTRVAEEAASSARSGDITVVRAQEAVGAIRRQVDLVVGHMLDLGRKSQQIGSILEIINELAEQTNILAINATIESAGAGEHGKRFAVVADEIRKLADRVGGSSKEIRTLIDEIRSAANTTVMATEDGAKAVEAGTRQFTEVTELFRQIAAMVETTTDASREIELGTKQQVSAVEQVNTALSGVAQAAKDAETTTRQTMETAAQLAELSHQLSALVQVEQRPAVAG